MKPQSTLAALVVLAVVVACATAVAPPPDDPTDFAADASGTPTTSDAPVVSSDGAVSSDAPSADAPAPDPVAVDATIDAFVVDAAIAGEAAADGAMVDAADAAVSSDAASPCGAMSGTLASFDFKGEPGNQLSSAPVFAAKGITASAIARALALKSATGANSIAASGWTSSASPDATEYFTFTLTPAASCTLSLASIAIDGKVIGAGPASAAIATSADGFVTNTKFLPGSASTVALPSPSKAGAIEVRLYGFLAQDPNASWRVQNALIVSGALK